MDYLQEFKPYYDAQIVPIIKELEQKRARRMSITGKICFSSFALVILIGLLIFGFSPAVLSAILMRSISISVVAGFVTYFILLRQDKAHNRFKLDVIKKIVTYMGDYDYVPEKRIAENEFLQSGIFEKHISEKTAFSSYSGNDYACGKIDDIKVELSEVDSFYTVTTTHTRRVSSRDSYGRASGHRTETTKTVKSHRLFKGLFFIATFKARFIDDISLYINSDGLITGFRKTLKDGQVVSSTASFRHTGKDWNKIFKDGRSEGIDDNERVAELKTHITEEFLEIIKRNNIKGECFVSYRENKMYIGIPVEKDLFENPNLLKYEDIIAYFQSINFALSAFKAISQVKDIWLSASAGKEEKLAKNICPWCEMKDSIVNNMCSNCGYKVGNS